MWSCRRGRGRSRGNFYLLLSNTCLLQFVQIVPFKLQKLSEAMYLDDKEEGMTKFRDLLGYLPAQMVRSLIIDLLYSFGKNGFPR